MFKKLIIFFFLIFIGVAAFSQQLPPKPATFVADFTNTLSPADNQQLESKLVAYKDSTSTQIAVVIIKSVGEYDINDYGQKIGRAWGIGQKGKNNGLLILVALDDHKVAIQTGYGAEGAVPDAVTQEIIQNDLLPHFKQNDYYGGLDLATNDLIKQMKGEYKANGQADDNDWGGYIALIIIVVVLLIIIFRKKRWWRWPNLWWQRWRKSFLVVFRRRIAWPWKRRLGRIFQWRRRLQRWK